MKRLIPFLLLCTTAFAQQDIRITQTGYTRTIANAKTWAGAGPTALANNYIYTPTAGAVGACVQVQNNDAGAHSITISSFGTGNSNPIAYTNNTGVWYGPLPQYPVGALALAANGSNNVYIRVSGASQIVITVTSGGGAGTASIFLTESVGADAPCRGGTFATFGNSGAGPLIQCDSYAAATIAAAGTTQVIAPVSTSAYYVCGISVTTKTALTGNGFTFIRGTGATCGGGTVNVWGPIDLAAAVGGSPYSFGGSTGWFIKTAVADGLCVTSAATVGTVDVTVWYTALSN